MSKSRRRSGGLAGRTTGLDLIRKAVGDKRVYTASDHVTAGLPMVVACTGCTMTMAGISAVIDALGYTWCLSCAPNGGA